MKYGFPSKFKKTILALGAESSGNFSTYKDGEIYSSADFGDLLEEKNWSEFKKSVSRHLVRDGIKPDIITTDLHPLFKTTLWSNDLCKKYSSKRIAVQHHLAHIFSSFGDRLIDDTPYLMPGTSFGVACDGTGYGPDGKIWGGELFKIGYSKSKAKDIERVGRLENQILVGGDSAIRQPARMLIGILDKFLEKDEVYAFVKKYYSKKEFEVIMSQLDQHFNCEDSSSTGRILDAVSILLGFCKNIRGYKHEPIDMLEKNSTRPYDIKPEVIYDGEENIYILLTTPLLKFLVKNIEKDKKRLAATAQLYIAQGLHKILEEMRHSRPNGRKDTFFAGGMANNKIISTYLGSRGAYISKKIPRGDAGISFGQIVFCLLTDPWD